MKILIALNTTWNLVNFRAGLIRAFHACGQEIVGVAPTDKFVVDFEKLGGRHVAITMDNNGTNPLRDLKLFVDYLRILRREKPDVVLAYTVKPNVYASIAAHLLRIPVINNIAGLGAVFIRHSILTSLVKGLYAIALSRSWMVFFQNEEDRSQFVTDGLVRNERTGILPGSGIDLGKFSFIPSSGCGNRSFRFLMVARLLWDKGVGEFVEATRIVKRSYPNLDCCLLGFLDAENPAAISLSDVEAWVAERVVRYLGVSNDVRGEIADADCIVLPSYYREGTPRSLLEAAAIGRPIITTDTTGCRNVVDHGKNGFLCRPRNAEDLAHAMIRMIVAGDAARRVMGEYGRNKMEQEYDERIVIRKYERAIEECTRYGVAIF